MPPWLGRVAVLVNLLIYIGSSLGYSFLWKKPTERHRNLFYPPQAFRKKRTALPLRMPSMTARE
jgi:hypothetical protein